MIVLGYVHPGMVHWRFHKSVIDLLTTHPDVVPFSAQSGALIARSREQLAWMVADSDATHLLFVDTDMAFEPDVVDKLLAHDVPIVGAWYHGLNPATEKTYVVVYRQKGDEMELFKSPGKGLQEVAALGMGCTLIKREVLEAFAKLYPDRPNLCMFREDRRGKDSVGEDVYFCQKAKEMGFASYVDWDTQAGHMKTVMI